jgi:hypothetical protein
MKRLFIPLIINIGKRIESKRFSAPPIYIGGCGRSGTTLLLSILSAHNDIFACPKELELFVGSKNEGKMLVIPNIYRLYRTFIGNRIKKTAIRYCEKSPSNIKHIEQINQLHGGDFKMIHILRDGRDVILSKHPKKGDLYWVDPERWINDVSIGLKYLDHPNIHTIKYEELVTDYENIIKGICAFLDIPLSREILQWHTFASVRQNNALVSSIKEINASSIGKWKKSINTSRVEELTNLPEGLKLLKSLNYLP